MSFFKNAGEDRFDALVAENAFVHDIQLAIEEALEERDMSRADLAAALGVSQPRVSQMLADNGKNLRARTIARVAHALGRQAFVDFIDHEADWARVEIIDESPIDQGAFAAWVTRACETLEAETPSNETGWPTPALVWSDGMAVAA